MSNFAERLRLEIDYAGLNQKEFAAKAGIKKRALDAYLGVQNSMPPADTAVKIAAALGVTVEYLVTGKEQKSAAKFIMGKEQKTTTDTNSIDIYKYKKFRDVLDDLEALPDEIAAPIKVMIKAISGKKRNPDKGHRNAC
jgi:transcriptional regulator with XRE-family HTH domain